MSPLSELNSYKVRVRIYSAYSDPGRVNYGQELFDFHWYWYALQLALSCEFLTMPGGIQYRIMRSFYQYEGPEDATVIIHVVEPMGV